MNQQQVRWNDQDEFDDNIVEDDQGPPSMNNPNARSSLLDDENDNLDDPESNSDNFSDFYENELQEEQEEQLRQSHERLLMQESEESRLWENDSSYLVAVSPRLFENDRIRLKLIMGYRVSSLVHGLDNDYSATAQSAMTSANSPLVPFNRRTRNRLAQFYNRNEMNLRMTPEQFNRLPEYQQRRILRERYLARQWRENRDLRDGMMQTRLQRSRQSTPYYDNGNPVSFAGFFNWAASNMNQIGWRSMVGVAAFVIGLIRAAGGRGASGMS